ncbi:MAG: carboxypeptidase regulatory-like domain-containing protein [Planctomycetes bacterium]|nr:carboxypeptidase regulatory-like domain-containing protein [Planctomycetota bacterium]
MEERFPRGLLIAIVAATLVIMVIGAIGLWEDEIPDVTGAEPGAPSPGTSDAAKPELSGRERAADGTDPAAGLKPAPAPADLVVTWELIEPEVAPAAAAGRETPLAHRLPLVPLPEVQGRLRVLTDRTDGGVTGARVVHGAPLEFRMTQDPAEPTVTEVEYRGLGRHLRVVNLATASGAQIQRLLRPRVSGAAPEEIVVSRAGVLEGAVVDADSTPVGGARVEIGAAAVTTDPGGRFRLAGVRGRQLLVYVTAPGFVPHREVIEPPGGFGAPASPPATATLRLVRAVQLVVELQVGGGQDVPSGGVFHLIPFGHQLAPSTLAVEKLGPIRASGSTFVVDSFPPDLVLCLVGLHPELEPICHRLGAATSDVRLTVRVQRRRESAGTVRRADTGEPVASCEVETSLDGLTAGDYLGATGRIPTGHEPGNFPLPVLDAPLVETALDGKGGFRLRYTGGLEADLAVRFHGPGLTSRTVSRASLEPELDVHLSPPGAPPVATARLELEVTLAGLPEIRSVRCRGLELSRRHDGGRGRVVLDLEGAAPGQCRLVVEAAGYESAQRTLSLTAGSSRQISAFLSRR